MVTDNLTHEHRQKTMRAVKGKGTSLERTVAAMLAGMRLRGWRKNVNNLPGKPDIVFDDRRLVIFVDGCFWHGCPICNRPLPRANRDYWAHKIENNILRAEKANRNLAEQGWRVLRIWEHELKGREARKRVASSIRAAYQETREE